MASTSVPPRAPTDTPLLVTTSSAAAIPMVVDHMSLLTLMADVLRLPEECLAMSFVYLNRYTKYYRSHDRPEPLDKYMLVLASLSLASKATEAPRRLREFILPAWRILQQNKPNSQALTFPSETYDALRGGLVQSELVLLRVLKFELRIPLPFEFLSDYLKRTVGDLNLDDGRWGGTEDYDDIDQETKDACQISDFMETGIAKSCGAKAVCALAITLCKDYQLANFFTAKTIAAACLYVTLRERGLLIQLDVKSWLKSKVSRTIDVEDFREAVSILDKLK